MAFPIPETNWTNMSMQSYFQINADVRSNHIQYDAGLSSIGVSLYISWEDLILCINIRIQEEIYLSLLLNENCFYLTPKSGSPEWQGLKWIL